MDYQVCTMKELSKQPVARLIVPTKDQDLSSKIENEWQQGNVNPQQSSIEVNYITTGSVVIWVKVDLPLFLDIQKFYPALDNLVNDIFKKYKKYAVNLSLYCVQIYDIATGYVDNIADEFHCGDCELKCNTLDNFISHKKTRCFQHILPEAIERLGGLQLKLECDHMKTKPLDPNNQNMSLDIVYQLSHIKKENSW
ncbi:FOG2 [Mytilus edulis]|uniref:ZFPM2 n=1 Tax=Mytilus edulis TaxID=6550 RepID=A0A8S3V6I2_MYTED|nr:FOG2 [Mytilus edulis]